jgi:hypothetical protein
MVVPLFTPKACKEISPTWNVGEFIENDTHAEGVPHPSPSQHAFSVQPWISLPNPTLRIGLISETPTA